KPLPRTPIADAQTSSDPARQLSVESRAHLRLFIKHALLEENLEAVQEWTQGIEAALKELSNSLAKGRWLPRLKVTRKAADDRRRTSLTQKRNERAIDADAGGCNDDSTKEAKVNARPTDDKKTNSCGSSKDEINSLKQKEPEPERTADGRRRIAIEQLQKILATPATPSSHVSPAHLLLTLSPKGAILPSQDMDFDIIPTKKTCVFSAEKCVLPSMDDWKRGVGGIILYGLDELDVDAPVSAGIVGGTFSFAGIASTAQFHTLSKILRLSVYVCLSLLLEQCVLSDSHVHLHFPAVAPALALSYSYSEPNPQKQGRRPAKPINNGLWSFFAKKTETLLHRATGANTTLSRAKSLEVPPVPSTQPRPADHTPPSRNHSRRISFPLIPTPSHVLSEEELKKLNKENTPIFSSALGRIVASSSVFSSSAGVVFPPPNILSKLAEKEKEDPNRKLLGSEKVSLNSLLGWDGRESRGSGMSGLPGFVRHQSITFLYTESISQIKRKPSETPVPLSGSGSRLCRIPCERGRWLTYCYFSRKIDGQECACGDRTLGDFVESLCLSCCSEEWKCEKPGCEKRKADHRSSWLHGGVRISAEVCDTGESEGQIEQEIADAVYMWESCDICKKSTERKTMTDGSYLFSFGKYLELLIYSPSFCTLDPRLCEHTTPPPLPWSSSPNSYPQSRFNIVRHFMSGKSKQELVFRICQAPALFELRVPRLQLARGRALEAGVPKAPASNRTMSYDRASQDSDEDKRTLRREIKQWWQRIAEHLDELDHHFSNSEISRKSLPRLPSYDNLLEDGSSTPKANISGLPPLPPSTPTSPAPGGRYNESQRTPRLSQYLHSAIYPFNETMGQPANPSELLNNMRLCFQRSEQSLYAQLSQTPVSNLNDVRRSFATVSKGTTSRLLAWEKKHCAGNGKKIDEGGFEAIEPEWLKPECHAIPGCKVIVRENEWVSLIAFTLSSLDYQREVANMPTARSVGTDKSGVSSTSGSSSTDSSYPPTTTSMTSDTPSTKRYLDPDSDNVVWYEPEPYNTQISRKDNPRDPSGLLSLRDVLRQRRSVDTNGSVFGGASMFNPSKFVSVISGAPPSPRMMSVGTPPSAWAQPAVEVCMHAADGRVSGLPEAAESAEKILQDLEASSDTINPSTFFHPWRLAPGSPDPTRRRRPPSLISVESDSTEAAANADTPVFEASSDFPTRPMTASSTASSTPTESTNESEAPPTMSPKTGDRRGSTSTKAATDANVKKQYQQSATSTSVSNSLASTVTNAMRFFLNQPDISRPNSPVHHHKLLGLENQIMDDRPHIKYDWTVGKRLKFSCTVYYAKQFESLRRRCGVEEIFSKSLERSENWAAEGGKSRSNFWKTNDDRFVIKTLVDAWNVADLQVLIEHGPSYFRYMETCASRPSVLAKLLGFYTIEIKNLESGSVQAKADLLVMENVFFEQKVTKTFDLKGIQGRKVKTTGGSSEKKTLFDRDWIEDQQKALILVQPHSKLVLQEAIKADADFLCKNNIMDYSLLLGVDEAQRQIACGLVDTIGSYTFAKTLEYKAKQNLKSGKEVTVIPPGEYHDRFVTAMNNYFIACPGELVFFYFVYKKFIRTQTNGLAPCSTLLAINWTLN
ncbi:hypothetical protein DFH11DRAFT_1792176, partial [Phellopilus nigrolimitatus]